MAVDGSDLGFGSHVPEPDELVRAYTQSSGAIVGHLDGIDAALVALEVRVVLAGFAVPDLDVSVV